MTNTEETETDLNFRATKYPKLTVATGGKGPPEEPADAFNWLAELEAGSVFLARARASKEVDYNLYRVVFRSLPEMVFLEWRFPDGKTLDYYVDPVRFSKMMELGKVLGQPPIEEVQEQQQEVTANVIDGDKYD